MSIEAEFNVLSTLFQSVAHDLKASSSAWENVCTRATKLSSQLNATVNCLSSFIDAVQIISDFANNIKGSSRDIGASLTRFCMRQRSLENLIRSLSNSLSDQFAGSMDKKSIEWRQKVQEIERRHAKNFKKTRSKRQQQNFETDCLQEQRNSCAEILFEQRNQFIYFVNALLPVMNTEVNLLDEGTHVRQVRDAIETTVNENDSQHIIQTLIEDLCHNGESSWHKRIASPTRSGKSTISSATGSHMLRPSSPSQTSSIDWGGDTTRTYSSISSENQNHQARRLPLSANTYIPPNSASTLPSPTSPTSKPPLPIGSRRAYTANSANTFPNLGIVNPLSMSANDLTEPVRRSQRPLSFSGDPSDFLHEESNLDIVDRNQTSRASAALIAETIDQIDRLGIELDSYCRTLKPVENSSGLGSSVASSTGENGCSPVGIFSSGTPTPVAATAPSSLGGAVANGTMPFPTTLPQVGLRYRPDSIRPPPPERRNSTITAATPNAPSIADLRHHQSISSRTNSTNDLQNHPNQPYSNYYQHQKVQKQQVSTPAFFEQRTFGGYAPNETSLPPPPSQMGLAQGFRPPPPAYHQFNSGRY